MARKHAFHVDMHVHSKFSGESSAEPRDIIEVALDRGLDGICVTEHESLSASAPFEEFRRSSGLTIIRGVELSTDAGHMLVYGVEDSDWRDWGKNRVSHAQELIDRVNRLGGIVVPAHPCVVSRTLGGTSWWQDTAMEVDQRILHLQGIAAIEVCNGKYVRYPHVCKAIGELARRFGIPGTGGSDAHVPSEVGRAVTVFRNPIRSSRDLVEAIRKGSLHPESSTGHLRETARASHISAR